MMVSMLHDVLTQASKSLNPTDSTPMYLQVAGILEKMIDDQVFTEGSALPSERDLTQAFNVSRVTIRQALGVLEERERLTRKRGSGTYVASKRIMQSLSSLTSFSDDMRARGMVPGARVISFERSRPNPSEALNLGISPTQEVYRLKRLRTANDIPLAIETSVLPTTIIQQNLTRDDIENHSLYTYLQKQGRYPSRALQHLRARSADPDTSHLLNLPKNSAILHTERITWDQDGRLLEYVVSSYRGDMYDFIVELKTGL